MAVENLITEHIDIWTSAVKTRSTSGRGSSKKLELYGIKKLRKLILELAVHGKLVPQDPNDEPADILVQRIMAKKKELLADGTLKKAKKSKVHDAIISAEELPLGWVAADFGDITFNLDAQRIPLSVSERKGRQGIYDYYGASGVIDSIDAYLFDKPLLLIGEDGANLVNRSTPIAFMARGKYWVNNHAHVIDGISEDFLIYLSLYINSISLIPYITGMAQPKMNQAKMNSILVLLPPEKEQHRIVAKVDELMTLCDQLEQQTEASIEAHQVLLTTLLDTLTNSADADELMKNWARISEHFDTLFTTEESIDQLKQTILQLAVMGKLVPQDPSDEPAAELLKKIAEEKALPPIAEDEKPFELPCGWEWCRGDEIADFIDPQPSHRTPPKVEGGVPYIGYTDIDHNSGIDFNNARKVGGNVLEEHRERYTLRVGDFVFGKIGTLGKPFFLPKPFDYCLSANLILIQPKNEHVTPKFLALYLNSPTLYQVLGEQKTNSTHGVFGIKKARLLPIPLPPIQEQDLIVAKIEELETICEQLKMRLIDSHTTKVELTDAIVEQAM
ncbi:restriction endonuclease subunit S [Vibrio parahaemolyticus]|nr:restriction endonuclease subunit S [Vibrio parahaemolyticus]EHK0062313.1 restriction endonuclease subunit S [Vibrio parahaemolyticus]